MLFLALFVGGNLVAIILAYAVAPTSAAEFPAYVRATLDRLLLHLTPTAALLLALGLKDLSPHPRLPPNPVGAATCVSALSFLVAQASRI